jgi:ketosteroid isomerase-like protein
MDNTQLVRQLYHYFNTRNIEAVLACLTEDVAWANGMTGGHVHGPAAVGDYWHQQWETLNPHVTPTHVAATDDVDNGTQVVRVDVHLVVHDMQGALLLDETVVHVFHLRQGLVFRFDIESPSQLSSLTPP